MFGYNGICFGESFKVWFFSKFFHGNTRWFLFVDLGNHKLFPTAFGRKYSAIYFKTRNKPAELENLIFGIQKKTLINQIKYFHFRSLFLHPVWHSFHIVNLSNFLDSQEKNRQMVRFEDKVPIDQKKKIFCLFFIAFFSILWYL